MTVAEYRRNITALDNAFTSLRGAVAPQEVAAGADRLRRAASRLMAATCSTAKHDDREAAEGLIDRTASYLIAKGL